MPQVLLLVNEESLWPLIFSVYMLVLAHRRFQYFGVAFTTANYWLSSSKHSHHSKVLILQLKGLTISKAPICAEQ